MRKNLLFTVLFTFIFSIVSAQTQYKPVSNLILNSTFSSGAENWTFSNPGEDPFGWRRVASFTYGTALWLDGSEDVFVATSNSMTLCRSYPKQVKFSFNSSNLADYDIEVKLGGQLLGTFTHRGSLAQSIYTPADDLQNTTTILYNFWPSHYVKDRKINNNIWHDFTIYIPSYQGTASGSITFEYVKSGISRPIYIDNVEVYEAIPTPVPAQTNVYLADCELSSKFNLTALQPSDTRFSYKWYRTTSEAASDLVTDPTQAGVGTYYLYAWSDCTGSSVLSYPSLTVRVHPAEGCCETNVIRDGTFTVLDKADDGRDVPKGDTKDDGGINWKRNFTNNNPENDIRNRDGQNVFYMYNIAIAAWDRAIYQQNAKISRWGVNEIEFDFKYGDNRLVENYSYVILSPNYGTNYFSSSPRRGLPSNTEVLQIEKGLLFYASKWRLNIPSGITAYVNGSKASSGSYAYNINQKYRIKIVVPANYSQNAYGGLGFVFGPNTEKYIGNISVIVKNPDTPNLANSTVQADCSDGTGDLTTLLSSSNITNYLAGLQYRWFTTNSSSGTMVANPQKAEPGTYYLFAKNPDTECFSSTGAKATVVRNCATINGAVYNDWDGAGVGGINNQPAVQNAVLYAILVNPGNNQVLKSMQLNADGTFSFVASPSTPYRVVISDRNAAVGSTAAPSYPPGIVSTGETINDSPDGTADGKADFTTGAGTAITTVNFGFNRIPIQDEVTALYCSVREYTIVLSSIDTEPNWNGGAGKKVIIQSVPTLTGGMLMYNNIPISAPYTISAYDPAKLTFKWSDSSQNGKVEFTYAFEDAAGHSMLNAANPPEPAKVTVILGTEPVIADKTLTAQSGVTFNYTPVDGVDGNIVPPGTTYSWTRDTPAGVTGDLSGTGTVASGISSSLTNSTTDPKIVTYTVTATDPVGCRAVFEITVNLKGKKNFWTGAVDTSFNTAGNWSLNQVPGSGSDIEFATAGNNPGGLTTQNNMVIPTGSTLQIGDLINETTNFAAIVSPGATLIVNGVVSGSETNPNKLQVKASETAPNGTLILAGQPCDDVVMGTVEMYARGYKGSPVSWTDNVENSPTYGQTFTHSYLWQYFGVPVKTVQASPAFSGSAVRKYNENDNGRAYYKKWEDVDNSSSLEAFCGYEITQDEPKIVTMQGALAFCNQTLTMTRQAPGVLNKANKVVYYGLGYNIFGNSYTSAIRIDKIIFPKNAPVEKTVYLYNTGSFTDWVLSESGQAAGTYTAVPQNTAPIVSDNQIPSMQGFLLKFDNTVTTPGTPADVTLVYADGGVMPNTQPQRVGRQVSSGTASFQLADTYGAPSHPAEDLSLSYLRIDLASSSTQDMLWLFSQEGTTAGFDNGWDGRKFFGTPTAFIYTETPDGPMQVSANQTVSGAYITHYANADRDYTLTLTKSNMDKYSNLMLHDLKTGTTIPLLDESTKYNFTANNAGSAEKRFLITGQKINSSEDKDSSSEDKALLNGYYEVGTQMLVLENSSGREGRYFIYTASGQQVQAGKLFEGVHYHSVSLAPGTYLVRLQAGTAKKTVKMIVMRQSK